MSEENEMRALREVCQEIKLKNERLEKALEAIDAHIREMQNAGIISMADMIRALRIISDHYHAPKSEG